MSTEVKIGVLGAIAMVAVVAVVLVRYPDRTSPVASSPPAAAISLSPQAVAARATSQDCWLIVNRTVYNVTGYIAKHPGGAGRIITYCGRDATTAFQTQGGQGQHSSTARATLDSLALGPLDGSTTQATIDATQAAAANAPANAFGDR